MAMAVKDNVQLRKTAVDNDENKQKTRTVAVMKNLGQIGNADARGPGLDDLLRACIFCGKRTSNKNKEHPIPRWLIHLTGEANRSGILPSTYPLQDPKQLDTIAERQFGRFRFNACDHCNRLRYGPLEEMASDVVKKIC